MAIASVNALVAALRQADLLTPAQLDELVPFLRNLSEYPQVLAHGLVQRGWLTSYQAEQILEGNAAQLNLGGFRLLEPLGSGGMGQVYKAWQRSLNRIVALKVIRPQLAASHEAVVKRFQREAHAVAQLQHPNIVTVHDFGQVGGTYFIAMECVDGPDLARLVREKGPLTPELALEYARQAAVGLQHAHEVGLVHRDIKPSNLLLAPPGKARARPAGGSGTSRPAYGLVKILDLGLARIEMEPEGESVLTREGAMVGTPDFIAPEQARDARAADIRSDLYSLGCALYFLLTGRVPFAGGTSLDKLMRHQTEEPTPVEALKPELTPATAELVRRLMAKKPEDRFPTPADVADALAEVIAGAPPPPTPPPKRGRRPPAVTPATFLTEIPTPA